MKKIIKLTESDLVMIINRVINESRTLSEQRPDEMMPGQIERFGYKQNDPSTLTAAHKKQQQYFKEMNTHTMLTALGIGSSFIPLVGPLISAGIGLGDAAIYYKEGDKNSALIVGVLSFVPFIGKIPGVKEFGVKGMASIAKKISEGGKTLTAVERKVIQTIQQNASKIKSELSEFAPKLKLVSAYINKYREMYVKKYGIDSYYKIIYDFIHNKITQKEFIQKLSAAAIAVKASAPKVAKAAKTGTHLGKDGYEITHAMHADAKK